MTKSSWFLMRAAADPASAEIMIYDEIGAWGITAKDFDAQLKALGDVKDITLRINSPGGDVFDGLAIHNTLDAHPATITAKIDGIAASAASLVAMAADQIISPENAFMLVHEPYALTVGPSSAHLAMAADLERMTSSFVGIYAKRTGQPPEAVRALMAEDRLMTATEAKAMGFADELTGPTQMEATFDLAKVPEKFRDRVAALIAPAAAITLEAGTVLGNLTSVGKYVVSPEIVAVGDAAVSLVAVGDAPLVRPAKEQENIAAALPAYGEPEIVATLDLCGIAGALGKAREFIAAKTPVADVREKLLEAKASADAKSVTDPVPMEGPTHAAIWDRAHAQVRKENAGPQRKSA